MKIGQEAHTANPDFASGGWGRANLEIYASIQPRNYSCLHSVCSTQPVMFRNALVLNRSRRCVH